MGARGNLGEVLCATGRFLVFRPVRLDMNRLGWHYLALGIISCQLAGMGRYWDAPQAHWWQYSGVGSLVYALFLAFYLWVLVMPMAPENWSYFNVLTFVLLTAPPAFLYAIPVEAWVESGLARSINYFLLLVVSIWRVGLLWFYLRRAARLDAMAAFFSMTFALDLIVVFLIVRQWHHNIFYGMSGNRGHDLNDSPVVHEIISRLGHFSILFLLPILVGYTLGFTRVLERKSKEGKMEKEVRHISEPPPIPKGTGRE